MNYSASRTADDEPDRQPVRRAKRRTPRCKNDRTDIEPDGYGEWRDGVWTGEWVHSNSLMYGCGDGKFAEPR